MPYESSIQKFRGVFGATVQKMGTVRQRGPSTMLDGVPVYALGVLGRMSGFGLHPLNLYICLTGAEPENSNSA